MAKDTFYFTHDYNARRDPKCIGLIKEFGASAYGLYWSLVEVMYEQGGKIKKFPLLFNTLSKEFNIREKVFMKQIEAMLHKYELLVQDENYIWSESVLLRLQIREGKKITRIKSGRKGGIKSGETRRDKKRSKTKQNEGTDFTSFAADLKSSTSKQNEVSLEVNEVNEAKKRKEKKIKEKENKEINNPDFLKFNAWIMEHAPNVSKMKEPFTENQYMEIKNRFSKKHVADILKSMHNYKPLLEKNISSYLTLIRWASRTENGQQKHFEPQPTPLNVN